MDVIYDERLINELKIIISEICHFTLYSKDLHYKLDFLSFAAMNISYNITNLKQIREEATTH